MTSTARRGSLIVIAGWMSFGIGAESANAVTAAEVSAACGQCHGLQVNGIVVAAGPGSLGFTAAVRARDELGWASTIARMVANGAVISDVNGAAAYLSGLGGSAPTPTATENAAATPTTRSRRPNRPRPHQPRPSRPGAPSRTPAATSATPAATATATVAPTNSGEQAYLSHCAVCHEPDSASFVGETIYGKSAGDIAEALNEVRAMQFLRPIVDRRSIREIEAYLHSVPERDDEHDDDR